MAQAKTVAVSKTVMSRTMLPSDANPYGNVHGGEVMKLIDAAAGAAATRHARARVVTARIDELSFLAPVYVGHLVTAMASVFAPFAAASDYFAPSEKPFMFNLAVDDLDGVLATCRAHGVTPIKLYDDANGRFAHLVDPEGTKIELWQPRAT